LVIVAKTEKPKTRNRYSIGEWYGAGFETLTAAERLQRAKVECEANTILGVACPFQRSAKCNKKGGVCSLRQYQQIGDCPVLGVGPVVTTCPQRFLEADTIFRWVGETLLQTKEPVVLSEIGFLDRLRPEETQGDEEQDSRDFIGRIDTVLVHPSRQPMDWCALELQAVYFSGKSMANEFKMLSEKETAALQFPAKHRRPDWRSSGPKRLLPQLQTKVPTIRTWGKKMAVVIDEAFFGSLVGLDRERHLSNAEIAWFVVGYDPKPGGWTLVPREVVFTKLDASVKSLTGGVPLSKERFEEQLREKLGTKAPSHPLAGVKES
jgi:Restriction endonuclease NotI